MTYHFTDTTPVNYSPRSALSIRAKWMAYFIGSWALTFAGLFGLLGDIVQVIFFVLCVCWFFSIRTAHKMGLLPYIWRFWLTVFRGR